MQLILSVFLVASRAEAYTYYVTPTPLPNPDCIPSTLCHTLAHYSQNVDSLLNEKHNVSLQFMNGAHSLSLHNDSTQLLTLFNIHSLVISGVDIGPYEESSKVKCIIEAPLISISNVSSVRLQNCRLVESILEIYDTELLSVHQFTFTNSRLYVNFGTEEVSHSLFSLSHSIMYRTFLTLSLSNGSHEAIFKSSIFWGQYSGIIGYIQPSNIHAVNKTDVAIKVTKCSFSNDSTGINLISESSVAISVLECKFQRNQRGFSVTVKRGAFHALIENTVFDRLNHNQGLQTYFLSNARLTENYLTLRNVSYLHNNVSLYLGALVFSGPLNLTFENCVFRENFGLISTLILRSVNVLFRKQNHFAGNIGSTGGALYMSHSTSLWLNRGAYITFENNTATRLGGAVFLEESGHRSFLDVSFSTALSKPKCFYQLPFSIELLSDIPILSFLNNSAVMGGDNIYGASLASDCEVTLNGVNTSNQMRDHIFQFHSTSLSPVTSIPKRVCLCENNVPQCDNIDYIFWNTSATSGEKFRVSLVLVGDDFGTVTGVVYASNFDDLIADRSLGLRQKQQQIVSNKACSDIEYSIHSKHQTVTLYLSVDSVTASSQRAIRSSLSFSKEELALARDYYSEHGIIEFILLNAPVSITINILPCPLGFELSATDLVCYCEHFLLQYVQSCSIADTRGMLHRNGMIWLSAASLDRNSSGTILAHTLCPSSYCRSKHISISLDQPDEQCDFNHSGILCGGCPPGFSLAIGSSRCIHCSDDRYLSLLLAFIAAGIVLLFVIKILDLTVACGTINGLIFYANILWINQNIFFPSGSDCDGYNIMQVYQFVKVFVAWLNLDLGIETCFFTGLDAYWKTLLQFVFPFYLWTLAALIVVACHYSSLITKLFGNNAVAVLATIIMLSYVKLLRTIVTILSFANLQQYNPLGVRTVWLEDGNIPYFGFRHSIIFIAAILVLFVLWLPFTALLLLIPCLKRSSNSKITALISKFKPLFDSFFGPLKDNHSYWIGLTMSVRVVLAIAAAVIQGTNPTINIDLAIVITLLLIMPLNSTYQKRYNCVFELLFMVNVAITGIAYLSASDMYCKIVLICVSGLISFALFLAILLFHTYTSLMSLYSLCHKSGSNDSSNENESSMTHSSNNVIRKDDPSSFATRASIDLREDILEL